MPNVVNFFDEVLQLQSEYSSENTPAMERRGQIIRNLAPAEMREWPAAKNGAALPFKGRLNVQGRDGTGLKTFVPWIRIHSPELSPSAQNGWYVVFLFRPDGSGVHLCISHGSTRFDGGDFKPRSADEAAELMRWSRKLLAATATGLGFQSGLDLGSKEKLARAYEATTAFSRFYAKGQLPSEPKLSSETSEAIELLGEIYRSIELGRSPEDDPPEITEAKVALKRIAKPQSESGPVQGQGFGLTQEEKLAVETHAMAVAQAWLSDNGYTDIRDVSAKHSCDYWASKNGYNHYVEVKGTTGSFGKILLTANEVQLHREFHPDNILIVVHDIDLIDARTKATGGKTRVFEEWDVSAHPLQALSYSCDLTKTTEG